MRSAYNYRYSCEVKEVEMKKNIGGIIAGLCAIAVTEFEIIKYINGREYPKYSNEWMQSLSDRELDIEREEVRKAWCLEPKDLSRAVELESILDQFDREIHKRKSDSSGYDFPRHTEHGWYLSGDD